MFRGLEYIVWRNSADNMSCHYCGAWQVVNGGGVNSLGSSMS